jgi:hypothetical protein
VPLDKASPAPYERVRHKKPKMIEVPPARIPEEPGAVIPHAGICEGALGNRPLFLNLPNLKKFP